MTVYINGKKTRADPKKLIGTGGEADIFQLNRTTVLKLFKPPTHPDYKGLPQEQQAASDRLQQHQQKLPLFPQHLPPRVIAPLALATDTSGNTILGYTMPLLDQADALLRYGERRFRQAGVPNQTVVQIFQDLHNTVSELHNQQVVIGDFNDLNVLVKGAEAYLIDADSFQFGSFPCTMFTARFVDPLLCDPTAPLPNLQKPPTTCSDWYAFSVMLMQCLLFVDPYGGVYKPKDPTQKVPHAARSLHRITVFHPEVRYPRPAVPYKVLPDELLHYFQQVFVGDRRDVFPRSLLDNLRWTQCLSCGTDHARDRCPNCQHPSPGAIRSVTTVRGTVTATRLFQTRGLIVSAAVEQGYLRWVYHDRGQFHRDDEAVLVQGTLNPHLRWAIQGEITWLGYQGQVVQVQPGQPPDRIAVDSRGSDALFAVNESAVYWVHQGQLWRRQVARPSVFSQPTYLGDLLSSYTHIWVGSRFGFGFYQAGHLRVAFVFDANKPGINDRVQLPSCPGHLTHSACLFSQTDAWLFLTTQNQGQIYHTCAVIGADGTIVATAQAQGGTDHWLATVGQSGERGCAIANALLVPTDEGIIRIDRHPGQLMHTKTFADTEPFVDSNTRLLPAPQGLYGVNAQDIYQLAIA